MLKNVGMTTFKKIGNSKGITFPFRLLKLFKVELKEDLEVYYDDEKNEVIIRKGGSL